MLVGDVEVCGMFSIGLFAKGKSTLLTFRPMRTSAVGMARKQFTNSCNFSACKHKIF